MSTPLDLAGKRFGRLTAIAPVEGERRNGCIVWHCECDCGNFAKVTSRDLTKGCTKSCGCLFDETRFKTGVARTRARRKLGLKLWGELGNTHRYTKRPGFMSQTAINEQTNAEVAKRAADRLRRGLCGDCGRPLSASIDGGIAILVCTCGFRTEVRLGSRAYRAARTRVELEQMERMERAVGE